MYSVHVYVCNHLYLIHIIYMLCFILFSVHSFVELVQYLFSLPDVSLFLSNRLCQDPLEKFFGEQRQRGRVNKNPNVVEFLRNTQALRVINTTCTNVKGNCRGSNRKRGVDDLENTPIPKRKSRYHYHYMYIYWQLHAHV